MRAHIPTLSGGQRILSDLQDAMQLTPATQKMVAWLLIGKQLDAMLNSDQDRLMSFCSFYCKLGNHLWKRFFFST